MYIRRDEHFDSYIMDNSKSSASADLGCGHARAKETAMTGTVDGLMDRVKGSSRAEFPTTKFGDRAFPTISDDAGAAWAFRKVDAYGHDEILMIPKK